jgi:hypothetical protein
MEIWVDNEKAWQLTKEYHGQGMTDASIAKKLYKDHGLVSMRGHKQYSPGAIFALRKNGKPKRNICAFVRDKPGKTTTTDDTPRQAKKKDMPVDKVSDANLLLTLAKKITEMDVDETTKVELLKKILH